MKPSIRNTTVAFALGAFAALAGCSYFGNQSPDTGYVSLLNEDAEQVGRAVIEKSGPGLKVELTISGLPAATYGVQIHDGEKCSGPGFDSIGAPLMNAANREPGGPEGVFPNFLSEFKVTGTATETTSFPAEGLTFRPGPSSLFAPGGRALVIDRLNFAGTYGKHVACGAITRYEPKEEKSGVPAGELRSAEHAHDLGTGEMTYRQPAQRPGGEVEETRPIRKKD